GDTDNRVRAIAQEVFGLKLAGWDVDSSDWCLSEGGGSSCGGSSISSQSQLENELRKWQTGSKTPGILGLEHELTSHSIQAFINTFDGIRQNGWDARCIPDLFGDDWYANAARTESPDTSFEIGVGPNGGIDDSAAPPSSASSASSASSTSASSSTTSSPASSPSQAAQSAFVTSTTTTSPPTSAASANEHPTAASQVATTSVDNAAKSLFGFRTGGLAVVVGVAAALFA
ncbi:hypothetical protein JCM6882_005177, partial [Rhodosporidiobolus microsporus]